jgi:hypothetical protein
MMDHPGGPPLRQRHVQCFEHQLGAQVSLHRPAHDSAAEGVQHYREIQETSPGRDIGNVSHPQPIRSWRHEVALDQVRRRTRIAVTHRGGYPLAPAHAGQAYRAH